MYDKIIIDVNIDLPQETAQYIVDCWTEYVYADLNYSIKDLPITLIEKEQ